MRLSPTHHEVWRLAGPMILSNLSIPLIGIVDTAVMGHLPDPQYIGAVAVGSMIFSFVFWGFGFLRMATTGLTAQAFGADNYARVRHLLLRAASFALLLAAALVALGGPLQSAAFWLIDASQNVEVLAAEYFTIRIWSSPATLLNYVLIGWFLGLQSARGPLIMLLTTNVTNIVLDLYFVVHLGWTVNGVATASVIAEYTGLVTGLVLLVRRWRPIAGPINIARLWRWSELTAELAVNRDIFIRTLCLIFAFAFFTQAGASQGDVILAANAILMNLQGLMAYGLDGFAHAAEALVGKALGRRNRSELSQTLRAVFAWSLGTAVLATLAFAVAGNALIGLMTDLPEVMASAAAFLPWMIASPLISVWSFVLDGIFIGASRGSDMRNGMIASLLAYLGVYYLLEQLFEFGNHGLWISFMVFLIARALSLAWYLRRQPLLQ